MRPSHLSELQIDALREVGSVGAGHAATALSQLVGRPVVLTVPVLQVVPFAEVPKLLGGQEELVGAVYARMLGDIGGGILFIAQRSAALALVDLLQGKPVGATKTFGREEEALFAHTASVLISAYLAAVARLADLYLLPSKPSFALDMVGAILQMATLEVGMKAESAVLVRTAFGSDETQVEAALFFLPDPDSFEVILGRLGVF
ncbi:MAG: chemotaxis protein CheC [Coriobacteriia bacterium]|nr:chemotaxis protein CheC [Coriobacteriia bacterium]